MKPTNKELLRDMLLNTVRHNIPVDIAGKPIYSIAFDKYKGLENAMKHNIKPNWYLTDEQYVLFRCYQKGIYYVDTLKKYFQDRLNSAWHDAIADCKLTEKKYTNLVNACDKVKTSFNTQKCMYAVPDIPF